MTNLFRSVRFNIFLGALITAAAALGTLVPQQAEMPEKAAAFQAAHPQWSRVFDFFSLFDLYQSPWFMGLLGLMALDIVLCKLWSLPPDDDLVALPPENTRGEACNPHQDAFACGLAYEPALARAKRALAEAGFDLRDDFFKPGGAAFVATKHRLQRWGSYLAHIGLVTILAGALVKALFGFVEMAPVVEGGSRAMRGKPDWEIFVDKFSIAYYDTGEPKSFSSAIRVESRGKTLGRKTIIVNDPLDIGGVRFYQASWGAAGTFRGVTLKVGKQELQLAPRAPRKLPGTPLFVEADALMPDFTITDGAADTASAELHNPAVRLSFRMGSRTTRPIWLFQNDPELCFVEQENRELARAPRPPFQLSGIDPVLFSGIQVAYDPGFKVVLGGSLLWLLGMIGLFYLHRRRLWVLVEPQGDGSRVSVGGWSSRGPRDFQDEFGALARSLRAAMEA